MKVLNFLSDEKQVNKVLPVAIGIVVVVVAICVIIWGHAR